MTAVLNHQQSTLLEETFGSKLKMDTSLAKYTSSRIGGRAECLLTVRTEEELASCVCLFQEHAIPFRVLGGGTNVLISDAGIPGVVVLNMANGFNFTEAESGRLLSAESGASFGRVARLSVERGLRGLEWAAAIPGTVGGAVVNNTGAFGQDVSCCLVTAEILQRNNTRESWDVARFDYAYRNSRLKQNPGQAIVLSAVFLLQQDDLQRVRNRMDEIIQKRSNTHPIGASWGSMFKNPPDDYAGRLIEAAGLKGTRVGAVEVSSMHANFFINHGEEKAVNVYRLIELVRNKVFETAGIELELEVELIGDWSAVNSQNASSEGER